MILWAYDLIILGILVFLSGLVAWNLVSVKRIRRSDRPREFPFVSILVPARDEEQNIERCLRSLLAQTYPNFEVLVYDDDSSDRTPLLLQEMARGDARVRIFSGKELPRGWLGKCFACAELARAARGDLLLFTDADTAHEPESVAGSVAWLERERADLVTLITRLEMKSLAEKLVLPLVHFIAFAYLPFALIRKSRNTKIAIGNGQFMLFRRPAYERIGGHESVRHALVEDVWLARRVKAQGLQVEVLDGSEIVSCRMYRNAKEIWNGFSKNIFAAFNYSLPAIGLLILFNMVTYLVPPAILSVSLFKGGDGLSWIVLPGVHVLLPVLMRLALALRFRLGILSCFFHSIGMALLMGIALNSIRWILSGLGASWKGRVYQFHLDATGGEGEGASERACRADAG